MPQIVFEHALLGGDLRARVEMLLATAAAQAEIRAARRGAHGCRLYDLPDLRELVAGLFNKRRVGHQLAGQRALDEDYLAVGMRDAAAFLIKRFNAERVGHCA